MYSLSGIEVVRDNRTILNINKLEIPTDKLTVVLGHNGSGKSTLVNILAGMLTPDKGEVALNQLNITSLSAKNLARLVAYLPQKLPASAGLTVRELVRLGRFPWRGVLGRWQKEDRAVIDDAMLQTGVFPFADSLADMLSGGEWQRAWVAMLLAQQTPVLILDEPTSALDIHHQYQLMNLLETLNREHQRGVIVILHDLNLTLRYATHVVALSQGQVVFNGETQQLAQESRLTELYQTPIKLIDHPMPNAQGKSNKVAVVCA